MATSAQPSTAVARREEGAVSIVERQELRALTSPNARAFIEPLLTHGVTFEQVCSEVMSAMMKDDALEKCTQASLLQSVAKVLRWGLTIGEKAYIIAYGRTATAVRDYKGDAELVIRAGGARFIDALNFYEKEPWQYEQGSNPFIKHTPLAPAVRGKLLGSYAMAIISPTLPPKIVVMYYDEIEAVRQKYSKSWKAGRLEDIPWYGPKTCVHRIVKLLPSTPGMQKIEREFETELAEVVPDDDLDPMNQVAAGSPAPAREQSEPAAATPAAKGPKPTPEDPYNF